MEETVWSVMRIVSQSLYGVLERNHALGAWNLSYGELTNRVSMVATCCGLPVILALFSKFADNGSGTDGILEKKSKHHEVANLWAKQGPSDP
jgi:hypothetical protein